MFFLDLHQCPKMATKLLVFLLFLMVFFAGFSSVSAKPPPAKIVSSIVSNVASMLWKWLWSLQSSTSTTKSAASSRSMMKFESGYSVETVFDGSKLGIEPYTVEVSSNGDLLVLDSENSNIYRISMPLSRYGRPKLVSGSPEGYTGHVDGKPRDARMNHPKGLAVDDQGNVYVADTNNMAIRKIGNEGVTTIAGGKRSKSGGHVDGPSENAKFSDDFDLVYVGTTCSLLIIDRGNQAIREIQLNDEDCSYQQHGDFHLGMAVLIAAGFFGYMLALLQRRVRALFSPQHDSSVMARPNMPIAPYQTHPRSVRPKLIPPQSEPEKNEGFIVSIGKLVVKAASLVSEIFRWLFSGSRKKSGNFQYPQHHLYHHGHHHQQQPSQWPVQESFEIPEEDGPPSLEPRTGMSEKTYPRQHLTNQNRPYDNYDYQQYQGFQQNHNQKRKTYYEERSEANEIVFGAVQEQEGRREAMVIKAVDYGKALHDQQNLRPRINYVGYSSQGY